MVSNFFSLIQLNGKINLKWPVGVGAFPAAGCNRGAICHVSCLLVKQLFDFNLETPTGGSLN